MKIPKTNIKRKGMGKVFDDKDEAVAFADLRARERQIPMDVYARIDGTTFKVVPHTPEPLSGIGARPWTRILTVGSVVVTPVVV